MATLSIQNGTTRASVELGGAISKVNAAAKRFAIEVGVFDDDATIEENWELLLGYLARYVRDTSALRLRKELRSQQEEAIAAEVVEETPTAPTKLPKPRKPDKEKKAGKT